MPEYDVIVIGAGASGLIAAQELAKAGKKVAILEAKEKCGGRIAEWSGDGFSIPAPTGAEFMHGKLPITMDLLKQADVDYIPVKGKMYQVIKGELQKSEEFIKDWPVLMKAIKQQKEDIPLAQFLRERLNDDKYQELRESVLRYVEGYDAADPERVSILALKKNWESDDEEHEDYFLKGGYGPLVDFLVGECENHNCDILTSTIVSELQWEPGHVKVMDRTGQVFEAVQVLVTVPRGVLQAGAKSASQIVFAPALPEKTVAVAQLGFGPVIKISLEFKEMFWEQEGRKLKNLGFVFTDATVPTWWPQPDNPRLLSGWLSGPTAEWFKTSSNEEILEKALNSLHYIFGVDRAVIDRQLMANHITNWATDPFALGAYSYPTVNGEKAIKTILEPVADTVFFAGEALHQGADGGTVEAAFATGMKAARQMLHGKG